MEYQQGTGPRSFPSGPLGRPCQAERLRGLSLSGVFGRRPWSSRPADRSPPLAGISCRIGPAKRTIVRTLKDPPNTAEA